MLRFKAEVRIGALSDPSVQVLRLALQWNAEAGLDHPDVEVNSARDGVHGTGSLHPWDLAWDLDVTPENTAQLWSLYEYLRRWLPAGYDVVWEGTHVHIEWDVKRPRVKTGGATWPPGVLTT